MVQCFSLILVQDKNVSASRWKKLTSAKTQPMDVQSIPSADETHFEV